MTSGRCWSGGRVGRHRPWPWPCGRGLFLEAVVSRVVVYGIKRYVFRYDTPDDLRRGGGPRGALLGRVERPARRSRRPRPADSGTLIGYTTKRDTTLEADIRTWVKHWNEDPKPFIWTKTAEEIFDSLARFCRRISGAGH